MKVREREEKENYSSIRMSVSPPVSPQEIIVALITVSNKASVQIDIFPLIGLRKSEGGDNRTIKKNKSKSSIPKNAGKPRPLQLVSDKASSRLHDFAIGHVKKKIKMQPFYQCLNPLLSLP